MLDRQIIERVAGALATGEGLVEQDRHVVRVLGILAATDRSEATPGFLLEDWIVVDPQLRRTSTG